MQNMLKVHVRNGEKLFLSSSTASCAVVLRPHLPAEDDLIGHVCDTIQAGEECGIQVDMCAARVSTIDNPNRKVFNPQWLEKAFLSVIYASWMAARKNYWGGRIPSSQQWGGQSDFRSQPHKRARVNASL